MSNYKGHVAGAVGVFALYFGALALVFSVDRAYARFSEVELVAYPAVLLGLTVMFGLWPDVDTNSKGQNLFYGIFFLVDAVLIATRRFEYAAYLGLFCILPVISKHRGWTHTFWAMLLIPAPFLALPYVLFPERPLAGLPFYGAAVVGYFSHLFMDGLVVRPPGRRGR